MNSKLVALLLGVAIGAVVCAVVLSKQNRERNEQVVQAVEARLQDQIKELKASLESSRERLHQAQQESDVLSAQVQQMLKVRAATESKPTNEPASGPRGLAALFGGDGTNEMSKAMTDMMKSAAQQQMEATLSGMKSRLHLSAEQEKAIRDIMARQMDFGAEIAQKMFKGELSQEELLEMGKEQPNQEKQIKAVLTPEQAVAYDEYQKEEQSRMARLMANSELLQMQSQLGLDEAQQDKVFAVLSDQALSQFDHNAGDANAAMDFRGQYEKKSAALKEVLTPEQFERYQAFQEQQIKLIESLMPKKSVDGGVTP